MDEDEDKSNMLQVIYWRHALISLIFHFCHFTDFIPSVCRKHCLYLSMGDKKDEAKTCCSTPGGGLQCGS